MTDIAHRSPTRPITVRTWATPLTIGVFLLMSVTGVLMFFDVEFGLVTIAHQWLSWLFLLGAVAHIVANARPFQNHLKSRWGKTSVAVFAILLAASMFSWGRITGPQLKQPIIEAIADAPLSALAGTTRTTPEALIAKMKARGITATSEQSVREISDAHDIDVNRVLGIVFLPEG